MKNNDFGSEGGSYDIPPPSRHPRTKSRPLTRPATRGGQSAIIVQPGQLPMTTDQAENLLLALDPPVVFQRDRMLVRIVRTQALTKRRGTERPEGAIVLHEVEPEFLVELLTKLGKWKKLRNNKLVSIDAPLKAARTYLARVGQWRVPSLAAVIEAPTIRPDGTLLTKPGYDAETGLYFEPGSTTFPTINPHPTRMDAVAALAMFDPVLRDFPWREPADESSALAGILTPLVRRTLPTAPMFLVRAPTMSSGKSLLVDSTSLIITGRACSVMSQGRDEDEQSKRMLAVLLEGDAVNSIDNVERPLGGAGLCSILTQESYQGRLLGVTRMVRVPTCTTWFATGNNLIVEGDLCSRVVICDLDPACEGPQERRFEIDLHKYIPAHRGELVAAGLTMMLAYHRAGRPNVGLKPFGRFEAWSDLVRSTIVWLDRPDPLATLYRIEDIDPVRRNLRELLRLWKRTFGHKTVSAGEVVAAAQQHPQGTLRDLLCEALDVRINKLNAQALGLYLRRYEGRIEDGLRFCRIGESHGSARWCVQQVEGGLGGVRGDSTATRENEGDKNSPEGGILPQVPLVPPSHQAESRAGDTASATAPVVGHREAGK